MGERSVRNAEVVGSSPIRSTLDQESRLSNFFQALTRPEAVVVGTCRIVSRIRWSHLNDDADNQCACNLRCSLVN